ncbi:AMP binding protein [Cantharellus anzutake]|uniref:AMP binding protein n=1 Tax=Cantharellus anzutake TaxID=1750568 RepID=UPI0019061A89|nr:AMP binding protein [Cantharellus anzutake]KAF8340499.1 AMP binding protein [Cantharellus anzutake]
MTVYSSPYPSVAVPRTSIFNFVFPKDDHHLEDIAFVDAISGKSYTRAQTQARARMVAFGLRNGMERKGLMNVSRRRTALVFSPNCLELPLIILGALAGGIVVSMASSNNTAGELAYQIGDCSPTHILVHPTLLSTTLSAFEILKVPKENVARRVLLIASADEMTPEIRSKGFLCIDDVIWDKKQLWPEGFEGEMADMTAMIFYSSGTTGLPKGTELSHYNIVSAIYSLQVPDRYTGVPGKDAVAGVLPFYHIYGCVMLVFDPLTYKIPSIVIPRFIPEVFLSTIQKYRPSLVFIAPPVAVFLANSPLVEKYDLSSVQKITSAAAPLPVSVNKLAAERLKRAGVSNPRLLQGYGMTELSPAVTDTPHNRTDKPSSVGKLLRNLEARLVDDEGRDVAPGQLGELWVRGPNVMRGYLNKPHATRSAITPDRWYKSGDIARRDEEGFFYILDRKKELIKYKGYAVAPAEIEDVICAHPSIRDCAVVGLPVPGSGEELPRAYVVPRDGSVVDLPGAPLSTELNQWVKERLAPYKQLRGGTDCLHTGNPKSPAGKVLRRVLKERAIKETEQPGARL